MMRSKVKENGRSLMAPGRAPPSRSAPKGLRLHREQETRQNLLDSCNETWETKMDIKYELSPRSLAWRGNQKRVIKIRGQTA